MPPLQHQSHRDSTLHTGGAVGSNWDSAERCFATSPHGWQRSVHARSEKLAWLHRGPSQKPPSSDSKCSRAKTTNPQQTSDFQSYCNPNTLKTCGISSGLMSKAFKAAKMLSKALQRRQPFTRLTEKGGSSLPHVACSVLNGHHACCIHTTHCFQATIIFILQAWERLVW